MTAQATSGPLLELVNVRKTFQRRGDTPLVA